jgi:hypothetical protein
MQKVLVSYYSCASCGNKNIVEICLMFIILSLLWFDELRAWKINTWSNENGRLLKRFSCKVCLLELVGLSLPQVTTFIYSNYSENTARIYIKQFFVNIICAFVKSQKMV